MGLALRELDDKPEKQRDLRDRLLERYGSKGLHVAELTQVGIVGEFLLYLVQTGITPRDTTDRLQAFLVASEDVAIFVKATDRPKMLVSLIKLRIESVGGPHTVIVCGRGLVKKRVNAIITYISQDARKYVLDTRESGDQLTAFIFTPEAASRKSHWGDLF